MDGRLPDAVARDFPQRTGDGGDFPARVRLDFSADGRAANAATLDASFDRPHAWAGGPYVGAIGEPMTLDGRGSYGVVADLVKWEWTPRGATVAARCPAAARASRSSSAA